MALATSLLQGRKQEWALAKRHESEDLFGAQVSNSLSFITQYPFVGSGGAENSVMPNVCRILTILPHCHFSDLPNR